MSQLAENITKDQRVVRLDEPLPAGRRFFRIDSELVEVTGRIRDRTYQRVPDGRRISIRRGQAESARAAHTAGADLTPYADAYATPTPFAGGAGGGVTVDNQDDPPAEVTTLIAPGAVIAGDEATLPNSVAMQLYEFPFAFDDAFVNDDYTLVHTVENDCYIVYSAFITLTGWGGAGAATMSWEAVRDGQTAFVECQDVAGGGSGGAMPREFPPVSRFAMPLSAGATIGIGVWTEDVLTSGTAKLMVLIAEPAA